MLTMIRKAAAAVVAGWALQLVTLPAAAECGLPDIHLLSNSMSRQAAAEKSKIDRLPAGSGKKRRQERWEELNKKLTEAWKPLPGFTYCQRIQQIAKEFELELPADPIDSQLGRCDKDSVLIVIESFFARVLSEHVDGRLTEGVARQTMRLMRPLREQSASDPAAVCAQLRKLRSDLGIGG